MKKVIYIFLALLLCVSCDSSEDFEELPEGIYTAQSSDLVFTVNLDAGKCINIVVEDKEGNIGTWTGFSTSGKYPEYTYSLTGFDMRARFHNVRSFNARLSGALVHANEGPNMDGSTNITLNGIEAEFIKNK